MNSKEYSKLLKHIKEQIRTAQLRTVSAANSQMLLLYWQLGNLILSNQQQKGWGAKIIPMLSDDLRKEFPEMRGFSERNLKYMRQFADNYPLPLLKAYSFIEGKIRSSGFSQKLTIELLQPRENQFSLQVAADSEEDKTQSPEFVQQPDAQTQHIENQETIIVQQDVAQLDEAIFFKCIVSKISWSHHVVLMNKEPHLGKRLWYMLNSLEHGNSRNVLAMQIESDLFERQVIAQKITNFNNTLPPAQSDFANYLLKDPYIFDFVQAQEKADERNIEEQLAQHITRFLLELGQGFAFIGRQVKFEVGNQDFYADLIFYHTKLHCYVVVELKARPFEPGDASQLNFYVNVVNDKLKTEDDKNTIGLLLCKGKNDVVAEYSLQGYTSAIGISDYQLSKAIPKELKSSLPQIEDIEKELKDIQ